MKISKAFASEYLRAVDFEDGPKTLTMKKVMIGKVGDDSKPILYFEETEMGLAMNKTNANIISKVYGDDTEEWIGKPIILYHAMVEFKGDMVPAIRCRAPKTEPRKEFKAKAGVPEYDDDGYPIK